MNNNIIYIDTEKNPISKDRLNYQQLNKIIERQNMKISDIIPYLNEEKTIPEIAKAFNKSIPRINAYISILRKQGYEFKAPKKGRPFMKI